MQKGPWVLSEELSMPLAFLLLRTPNGWLACPTKMPCAFNGNLTDEQRDLQEMQLLKAVSCVMIPRSRGRRGAETKKKAREVVKGNINELPCLSSCKPFRLLRSFLCKSHWCLEFLMAPFLSPPGNPQRGQLSKRKNKTRMLFIYYLRTFVCY